MLDGLMSVLSDLSSALAEGRVDVVDLTAPLSDRTPILQLPPPFANTQRFALQEISNFDDRDPPGTGITSRLANTSARTSTRRCTGSRAVTDRTCRKYRPST